MSHEAAALYILGASDGGGIREQTGSDVRSVPSASSSGAALKADGNVGAQRERRRTEESAVDEEEGDAELTECLQNESETSEQKYDQEKFLTQPCKTRF